MAIFQNKIVIIVLGSIVAAFAAWYIFLRDPAPAAVLQTDNLIESTGEADRGVVETLLQLRAITLSGTIFTDPAFLSLRDTGTQIIPEPVGRANPFLPIGITISSTTAPAATSTATSTPRGR